MSKMSFAQFDLSINPVSILFSNLDVNGEYCIISDFGIEGSLGFDFGRYDIGEVDVKNNGIGFRLIGKYYFNPDENCTRWNIGPYVRYSTRSGTYDNGTEEGKITHNRFAVGLYTGYKWVTRRKVVFELGLGLGRTFVNDYSSDNDSIDLSDVPGANIDVTGKLGLGYRF